MEFIKLGDKVKVISKAQYDSGLAIEHIPIGTICEVADIEKVKDGSFLFGLRRVGMNESYQFYYKINEIEVGHEVWIPQRKGNADQKEFQKEFEIVIKENTGSRREHCIRSNVLPISLAIDSTLTFLKQNKDTYNIEGDVSIFIKSINLEDL